MLTDGACLELDGRLSCRSSKVFPMPHLNAALAVSGGKFMGMLLADQIGRTEKTFDELKSGILAMSQAVEASVRPAWEKQFGKGITEFNLFVAGISETRGPDSFLITNHDDYLSMGVSPWTLVDLGEVTIAPSNDAFHAKWAEIMCTDDFGTEAAISLMNDQRQFVRPNRAGIDVHTVGCFAQLTTVQRGQISSRLLHRWDEDVIGEPINGSMSAPQ
ncbi:hypothetical protein [Bradyrhizobium diazoefficiens]|uniref:hypothetical protein n=1 Tax=Bradyrhizobium diazoefficiens TaxID=1355477 RepID=UPI001B59906B|nr:hypothetical protein [Bradyrhizobium japonicum]